MRLVVAGLLDKAMTDEDCTGAQLGRRVGVSREWISQLRRGLKHSVSDELAVAIEDALGVTPETLFRRPTYPFRVTVTRVVTYDVDAHDADKAMANYRRLADPVIGPVTVTPRRLV